MKIQINLVHIVIAGLLAAATFAGAQYVSKRDSVAQFASQKGISALRDAAIKEAPATAAYLEELVASTVTPIK